MKTPPSTQFQHEKFATEEFIGDVNLRRNGDQDVFLQYTHLALWGAAWLKLWLESERLAVDFMKPTNKDLLFDLDISSYGQNIFIYLFFHCLSIL